jgi:hypothetical protein
MWSIVPGARRIGAFKMGTVNCSVKLDFEISGKFQVSYYATDDSINKGYVSADRTSFWDDVHNIPEIVGRDKLDGSYRLIYCAWSHNGVVYRNSNHNITVSQSRILKQTFDHIDVSDLILIHKNLVNKRCIRRLQAKLHQHFISSVGTYGLMFDEFVAYALSVHPKRQLRRAALHDLLNNCGRGSLSVHTIVRNVRGKLKLFEIAKPGKAPRLIADLGVEASLIGGFVCKKFKECMASFRTPGCYSEYIESPDIASLTRVFDKLINLTDKMYFPYFSDDSCISLRCSDGVFLANIDISSCDGTHTTAIFEWAQSLLLDTPMYDNFLRCMHQLQLPLVMSSSAGDRSHIFRLYEGGYQLYSGSTCTTLVNNVACLLFSTAVSQYDFRKVKREEVPEILSRIISGCGYKVTIDVCSSPQDLQFLKHSPNIQNLPWLNFGPILRSMGIAKFGYIPRTRGVSRDLKTQCFYFEQSKIKGLCNAGSSAYIRLLAEKYNVTTDDTWSTINVDERDLISRYKCTVEDYHEFLSIERDSGFGYLKRCRFSDLVFSKDYGLELGVADSCSTYCTS